MEDAVEHRPFEERDHLGPEHGGRVDPDGSHALDVVPGEAVEPFHDKHAARDQPGVRSRHDDGLWPVSARTWPTSSILAASSRKSSSSDDRLREQLDESGGVGERRDRDPPDQERGEEAHGGEVPAHELGDLGPLDLDDHSFAGQKTGAVHLGNGGGGDRGPVELGEGRVEGAAELRLDDAAHRVERLRGHSVEQQAELRDDLLGEDPFSGREDLPELDVCGSESAECDPQPPRQTET